MKKNLLLTTILSLGLIILGAVIWIFQEPLMDILKETKTSSIKTTETNHGVIRQTSYIGKIREAEKLIEHEYYSLATIELSGAIQKKPELIKPYLLLGEIYIRTRETNKLNNLIIELKKQFPKEPEIIVLEGRKLISEKKFQEALTLLENAGDKISPMLKFYQAVLLALQNDHEQAKKILNELSKLPVESRDLVVGESGVETTEVSNSNFISPEFSEKIKTVSESYNEFSKLSEGTNPHLFAVIAKTLAEKNEAILALEFADVAIKEDIEYIDAWIIRGYANFLLKEFDVAIKDLRHAYELDPIRPQTHYFLALALHEIGNNEEAALFFEKSLEHNFEFSDEVRWKLIEIFSKQEKYDRVVELYRELLNENSEEKEYISALHTVIDVLKKPEIALEFSQKLISHNPEDDFAMNMHGWALIANKNFITAEKILKQAEELNPKNPRTYLNLGLLYEEQAKFSEAKEYYKKSYELGKNTTADAITNLAVEKYNELISQTDRPKEPEAPANPKNSP